MSAPVWLDLHWLEAHGPNIHREPERLESIDEGGGGQLYPDMASAQIALITWQRNHPYWLLVSAQMRDRAMGSLISDELDEVR